MADFTSNNDLPQTLPPTFPQTVPQTTSKTQGLENGAPASKTGVENAKNAIIDNAAAAGNAVKNHPLTQSVANGPVAENLKDQTAKTSNEFSNLAAARTTPANSAATGQPLTHYHSFFTTLLSWDNPRASGIAYIATVAFIFAARYLHILRYAFKLTWVTLGVTVLAEVAGKYTISTGLTSQFRPKRYFTLSKDTLNALVGDVHELINFFVIETQRVVFVENILVSATAFIASFISYYLIKVVPFWGLSLIATSVAFLAPLVYKSNKELIDAQLNKAANIANQQTEQVRKLASQSAARATETTKQYVGDYSAKASEIIGGAKRSVSPSTSAKPIKSNTTSIKKENVPSFGNNEKIPSLYQQDDFPAAPREDFKAPPAVFQAPPVGQTANALRTDDEPLIVA